MNALWELVRSPFRKAERYKGLTFPPRSLRTGGKHFADNAGYHRGALGAVRELDGLDVLDRPNSVLDIGCGAGRLPIGILAERWPIERYVGVDVDKRRVDWCAEYLAANDSRLSFVHLDAYNARYNPQGTVKSIADWFSSKGQFDLIYLYSVFSHLNPDDVQEYLAIFPSLLTPSGLVYVTAFVEDDVEDYAENPEGYGDLGWAGRLHCCRYNRQYMEGLFESAGLNVAHFSHGTQTDGQSLYLLSKA